MSHPFVFRPGTNDNEVFGGVIDFDEYRLPPSFHPEDIILDIGMHIGSFCYAALERGSHRVYGFEPFAETYECAMRNLARFGNRVTLRNQAVWRSDRRVATLSLSAKAGDNDCSGHVIAPDKGIPVDAVAFDDIVLEVTRNGRRRIRMVKIDCEGAEFPILFTSRTLHLIDSIVGEYHNFADNYDHGPGEDHHFHRVPEHAKVEGHDRYTHDDLAEALRLSGFDVTIEPIPHLATIAGWFFAHRVTRPALVRDRLQWHWHGLKYRMTGSRRAG